MDTASQPAVSTHAVAQRACMEVVRDDATHYQTRPVAVSPSCATTHHRLTLHLTHHTTQLMPMFTQLIDQEKVQLFKEARSPSFRAALARLPAFTGRD
ncbi:hypothetical protein J6590_055259 [Homalodisca vitripennis]|nr:hypothetical protein J6590_055259 [Homalodisca vitripennis]